jgi:hypothetical protein
VIPVSVASSNGPDIDIRASCSLVIGHEPQPSQPPLMFERYKTNIEATDAGVTAVQ